MTTTHRAVVYVAPTGDETVLTSREEAHLPDNELLEAAMREARDADLIGDEWPRVPEDVFRARLQITECTARRVYPLTHPKEVPTMTEQNYALKNAEAHAQRIVAMVKRLEHTQECDGEGCELTDAEILAGLNLLGHTATEANREEYHDENAVMEAILEDPLSVEVRSNWHSPGSEDNKPAEYQILLSTGGPAARIIGKLNEYGEPETAILQYQDWGTPWIDYAANAEETEALLEYARYFYFEEATR